MWISYQLINVEFSLCLSVYKILRALKIMLTVAMFTFFSYESYVINFSGLFTFRKMESRCDKRARCSSSKMNEWMNGRKREILKENEKWRLWPSATCTQVATSFWLKSVMITNYRRQKPAKVPLIICLPRIKPNRSERMILYTNSQNYTQFMCFFFCRGFSNLQQIFFSFISWSLFPYQQRFTRTV